MTSKEALERIKTSHKIAMAMCCEGRKDEETEKAINEIEKDLDRLEKLEKAIKIYQKVTQINEVKCKGLRYYDLSGIWGTQLSLGEIRLLKELKDEER